MEVAQDFKAAWKWFILHKIGQNINENPDAYKDATNKAASSVVRLLGLSNDSIFNKALGFMPRLEGTHVRIHADIGFFEAELAGDLRRNGETTKTTLEALSRTVIDHLVKLIYLRPIYIYFDELEEFYHGSILLTNHRL